MTRFQSEVQDLAPRGTAVNSLRHVAGFSTTLAPIPDEHSPDSEHIPSATHGRNNRHVSPGEASDLEDQPRPALTTTSIGPLSLIHI